MREVERRIRQLEDQRRHRLRRPISSTPIYTMIRDGEPRPDVDGPVYVLVSA